MGSVDLGEKWGDSGLFLASECRKQKCCTSPLWGDTRRCWTTPVRKIWFFSIYLPWTVTPGLNFCSQSTMFTFHKTGSLHQEQQTHFCYERKSWSTTISWAHISTPFEHQQLLTSMRFSFSSHRAASKEIQVTGSTSQDQLKKLEKRERHNSKATPASALCSVWPVCLSVCLSDSILSVPLDTHGANEWGRLTNKAS